MSELDVEAVHGAIADIIRDAHGDEYTVTPFPARSSLPSIEVWPNTPWITHNPTQSPQGNPGDLRVVIRVAAYLGDDETAFKWMTRALSPASDSCIVALLDANPTLRGTASSIEYGDVDWDFDVETGIQSGTIAVEVYG